MPRPDSQVSQIHHITCVAKTNTINLTPPDDSLCCHSQDLFAYRSSTMELKHMFSRICKTVVLASSLMVFHATGMCTHDGSLSSPYGEQHNWHQFYATVQICSSEGQKPDSRWQRQLPSSLCKRGIPDSVVGKHACAVKVNTLEYLVSRSRIVFLRIAMLTPSMSRLGSRFSQDVDRWASWSEQLEATLRRCNLVLTWVFWLYVFAWALQSSLMSDGFAMSSTFLLCNCILMCSCFALLHNPIVLLCSFQCTWFWSCIAS